MNVEGAFRLTSRSGCEEAVDQGIGGRVVNAGLYHYRINVRGRVPASNAQDRVVFADADGGDIAGCYYEWRVEAFDRFTRTLAWPMGVDWYRSEERRVGTERVRPCRSRVSPYH